jgi:hypothetical protein
MVVTFFGKGKIIFAKMDKFQRWIAGKDVEWAKHVSIFGLFNIQFSPVRPLVKE